MCHVPTAPPYSGHLFVNRENALNWLAPKIAHWAHGPVSPAYRLFGFRGERGIGKSWLLQQLLTEYGSIGVYFDLTLRGRYPTPADFSRAAQAEIGKVSAEGQCLLILLDGVPPQNDRFLEDLERTILAPQFHNRNAMIVMCMEHTHRVCWSDPALRAVEPLGLEPFDHNATRAQLSRLFPAGLPAGSPSPSDIAAEGQGNPLLNFLLASRPQEEAFESFITYCLGRVSPPARVEMRHLLAAVCTLDALDSRVEQAIAIYETYYPGTFARRPNVAWVRNNLFSLGLAHVRPGTSSVFTLTPAVGHAARRLLEGRNPVLFSELVRIK